MDMARGMGDMEIGEEIKVEEKETGREEEHHSKEKEVEIQEERDYMGLDSMNICQHLPCGQEDRTSNIHSGEEAMRMIVL